MAFNFFKRKKPEVLEVVEPPKQDNRIDADLLLMQHTELTGVRKNIFSIISRMVIYLRKKKSKV